MKDLLKIEEIYHAALQRPMPEREDFLREICEGNDDLRREVESLLSFEEKAENFIETPPADLAAALFTKQKNTDILGKRLNHYQILSAIGAGGMGEVYLAEDTKLGRNIALKLLPAHFAQDAERKARFEKEARAVSALNHPNIITIFSIEQTDHYNFIATEFIDGQTLREKISEKPLSWREAVDIGIQIADALESAHKLNIIHRDIKPANIMLRADGIVKVLDFGLAKLLDSRGAEEKGRRGEKEQGRKGDEEPSVDLSPHLLISSSPLLSTAAPHLTNLGAVMGTINYMSPEQALGEKVDARTDIFSLGVVLYEMLSGVQPFKGMSDASVYNATINKNPLSLAKSNSEIPFVLDKIVSRAIEKDCARRYQTISELRSDLQKLKEISNPNISTGHFLASRPKASLAKAVFFIGAVLVISAAAYFLFFKRSPVNQLAEAKNLTYSQLTTQSGEELFPSLSPDGKTLIYASRESGNWDIYFQRVGGSNPVNLTKDSAADDRQPAYSPNGDEIAFRSERDGGGIFVMGATGENVRRISNVGFYPNWSPDGKEIVYGIDDFTQPGDRSIVPSELWVISVSTGEKRLLTKNDAVQPSWSPNGFRIAYWGINEGGKRDVWTISAAGGDPVPVTGDTSVDWNPVWSADGNYLYFASDRSGSMNLWRVAIDEKSGAVSSQPESVTIPSNYSQFFNFSRDGKSFAYVQSTNYSNIFQIDFNTQAEAVGKTSVEITRGSKITTNPEISLDNQSLVFDSVGDKQEDIFVSNADGSGIRQLTNDAHKDRAPRWSPDGKRVAFFTDITGRYEGWMINTDGSNLRQITQIPGESFAQIALWSPDGKRLLYNTSNGYPIIYDPDKSVAEQTPEFLPGDGAPQQWFTASAWSSDGKKLVGSIRDIGKAHTYLAIYDFAARKYEPLNAIGSRPRWLADNRRIIFYSGSKIFLLDTFTKRTKELFSVAPFRTQAIAISTDNRSIYYTVQKSESDIWLANFQQ